ncbi:hypothetical protein [Streptomyces cyslabdanicus]|uniref:hypothetical protein n=1 Tax=Streptomyces cyslabdanicus TaxID=1470456 RepID=UPI004044EA66
MHTSADGRPFATASLAGILHPAGSGAAVAPATTIDHGPVLLAPSRAGAEWMRRPRFRAGSCVIYSVQGRRSR